MPTDSLSAKWTCLECFILRSSLDKLIRAEVCQ